MLEGCDEVGAEVEWIHPVDYDIKCCRGCFTCLCAGECPIQDNMLAVRDRLLAVDGVVAGSPVCADLPTGQLKALLDRPTLVQCYILTFEEQPLVGVAAGGMGPTGGAAKGVANFSGRRWGIAGARVATTQRGWQLLTKVHDAYPPGGFAAWTTAW